MQDTVKTAFDNSWRRECAVVDSGVLNSPHYPNDPKVLGRYAWANSADPDQTADQGLHCLPFRLHRLDSLLYIEPPSSNFLVITTNVLGVRIFRKFTVFWFTAPHDTFMRYCK